MRMNPNTEAAQYQTKASPSLLMFLSIGCSLLALLNAHTLQCQWSKPKEIDSALRLPMSGPKIATGPHREIAVTTASYDTLYCYFSNDNGRSFTKSIVAHGLHEPFVTGYIGRIHGIGFDSQSRLFIMWRQDVDADLVGSSSYRISRSLDSGKTFTLFWASSPNGPRGPSLVNAEFFIDPHDGIHCIWDSTSFDEYYVYSRFSSNDSAQEGQAVLPSLTVGGYPASAAVYSRENSVHVALTAQQPSSANTSLYYLGSSDLGSTFSVVVPVDTLAAWNPQFVRCLDGRLLLSYTTGPHGTDRDTAIIFRYILDSIISDPIQVIGELNAYSVSPSVIRQRDSSIYAVYNSPSGLKFLELNAGSVVRADSSVFAGHYYADLALDSIGGKYLVSIFNDRVCLTTRDVVLGMADSHDERPGGFLLEQNFPNPFNPTTDFGFRITDFGLVTIKIYDLLGREISTLLDEQKLPGVYRVSWDAIGKASGVYFYKLQTKRFSDVKKMILLR